MIEEAEQWYGQALAAMERLDDRSGVASALNQLGRSAQARGRFDVAQDHYTKSLAISEALGDRDAASATVEGLRLVTTLRALEDPEPPEDLVTALAERECALFAGYELAAWSGYPTRAQLLESVIAELEGGGASVPERVRAGELELLTQLRRHPLDERELNALLSHDLTRAAIADDRLRPLLSGSPLRAS